MGVNIEQKSGMFYVKQRTGNYFVNQKSGMFYVKQRGTTVTGGGIPEPLAQPTNLVFSNITISSMDLSWTAATGSPAGYIVLRSTSAVVDVPVDLATYNVGDTIGAATVEFIGSGTSFTDSSLSNYTRYYYAIFSYNGASGTYNFLTTAPLTGNEITLFDFGNSIRLDGSNDYGTISTASFFGGKTQFTLAFWVNFDVGASLRAILWDGNSSVTNGFAIRTSSASNALNIYFGKALANQFAATSALGSGSWKHVRIVYNGAGTGNSGKVQVYINGVQDTLTFTGTIPSSIGNSTINTFIGARSAAANFLDGKLDEMCLWNNTTGSDTYNSGNGATPSATNLQNYWKFNESNPATTATDTQGANNIVFTNLNFDANSGWEAH